MPEMDTIVLKLPPGTKARWVRQSQRLGQPLSVWVMQAVDKPANKTALQPCPACSSVAITYDRGDWLCAQCGVMR